MPPESVQHSGGEIAITLSAHFLHLSVEGASLPLGFARKPASKRGRSYILNHEADFAYT